MGVLWAKSFTMVAVCFANLVVTSAIRTLQVYAMSALQVSSDRALLVWATALAIPMQMLQPYHVHRVMPIAPHARTAQIVVVVSEIRRCIMDTVTQVAQQWILICEWIKVSACTAKPQSAQVVSRIQLLPTHALAAKILYISIIQLHMNAQSHAHLLTTQIQSTKNVSPVIHHVLPVILPIKPARLAKASS